MSTLYLQVTSTSYFLSSTSLHFQKKLRLKDKKYNNKKPRITLVDRHTQSRLTASVELTTLTSRSIKWF